MSGINVTSKFINFICFPWKQKETTHSKKAAAWAAFLFVGWIYHPLKATQRGYKKLIHPSAVGEKVNSLGKKTLLKDPISKTLAAFDNPRIRGQINGIYITTNETNLAATRELLRKHPRPSNEKPTIHIGCATWHNFDMMFERKSNYGLIVDFNPQNAKFIEKTIEIINLSESRDSFKENMLIFLNSLKGEQRNVFFHKDQEGLPTDRIEKELKREGSWLETEESYLFIKKLASTERLVSITEDITNFETFSRIRKFLDRNNMAIDTLYLSNICNFMNTDSNKKAFEKSIKHMLRGETILVNCPKIKEANTAELVILHQKTSLGSEILASSYDSRKLFEETT